MSSVVVYKQQQNERDEAVVAVYSMRGGQPQRMTGRRAMTLFVALRLCWMQPI